MRNFTGTAFKLFTILSLCLLASCGSGDSATFTDTLAHSTVARNVNPQVPASDLTTLVAGNTEFALNVFRSMDADSDRNTFFSPYSITQTFLLVAPGARGATLSQIELALCFPLAQDRLYPAFNKLDLLIADRTRGVIVLGDHYPSLRSANAVWAQSGPPIIPTYLDALAANFGEGLHLLDFANSSETSRTIINDWVAARTGDRIAGVVPEGGLSPASRLVLTNATWFKADWAYPFSPEKTRPGSFHNRNGSVSSVPFMADYWGDITVPYAQLDICEAVELPYAGKLLSMLVIMPRPGTFDTFISTLSPASLSEITGHLSVTELDLSLPKFSFTKTSSMRGILQSLGIVDAFNATRADFSGINGRRDLAISEIFHEGFIGVGEDGTEAAVATDASAPISGVIMRQGDPPRPVTVDHPFIFLIRDRQTGSILFMGKVASLAS